MGLIEEYELGVGYISSRRKTKYDYRKTNLYELRVFGLVGDSPRHGSSIKWRMLHWCDILGIESDCYWVGNHSENSDPDTVDSTHGYKFSVEAIGLLWAFGFDLSTQSGIENCVKNLDFIREQYDISPRNDEFTYLSKIRDDFEKNGKNKAIID